MNLGNWDGALFKSLFTSSLLIPIAYLADLSLLNSLELSELAGLLVSFLLYIGVFILISLIGWLFIGFPIHWLVCKFSRTNYFYYGFCLLLLCALAILLTALGYSVLLR